MKAVILVVMVATLAGCGANNEPRNEVWPPVILDEPIRIGPRSIVEFSGAVETPGPIVVEGTLLARNIPIRFVGPASTAVIRVEGGTVHLDSVQPNAPVDIFVGAGGRLTWLNSSIPIRSVGLDHASQVSFENTSLIPETSPAGDITTRDANLRIVNSTIEGFRVLAEAGGTARLVNVGATFGQLGGSGVVEIGFHLRVRRTGALGNPLGNETVRVDSVPGDERLVATTGGDGVAYLEVTEAEIRGGTLLMQTPHRVSSPTTPASSIVLVRSQDQEVVLISPED